MIDEIRVEKMEQFKDALVAMKTKIDANALPEITSGDNGKVLTATYSENEGSASWEELPSTREVPAVTSVDDGKILGASYNDDTGSYGWIDAPSGGGLSYEDGETPDVGTYVEHGTPNVEHIVHSMVISIGATKWAQNFTLSLSSLPDDAVIMSAYLESVYPQNSSNYTGIPVVMVHTRGISSTDWNIIIPDLPSFDLANQGIYCGRLFITYYGTEAN